MISKESVTSQARVDRQKGSEERCGNLQARTQPVCRNHIPKQRKPQVKRNPMPTYLKIPLDFLLYKSLTYVRTNTKEQLSSYPSLISLLYDESKNNDISIAA